MVCFCSSSHEVCNDRDALHKSTPAVAAVKSVTHGYERHTMIACLSTVHWHHVVGTLPDGGMFA
jgi:hypothetical protein